MKIAKKVLKAVDESQTIKGMLGDALDKSHQTIQRYIDNNDEALTMAKPLAIIESQTGFAKEEILVD
jgi:hypothetical protein